MKYETVKHRGRTLRIPVDDDGYVPQDALLGRFEEWADKRDRIQADGSTRHDPRQSSRGWKDYTHRSETVLPAKVTPKQAASWWHNPGKCDIEGIDTPGRPKRNTQGHGTKAQRAALAKIPVTAIELEEATVRRNLLQSFTNDELIRLGKARVKIHVYPRTHTAVGTYESRRNLVTVDRKHSIPQTTVTHEAVHALRDKDRSRRGILAQSKIEGIEESLTVAEQQARTDKPGLSGYYWDCKVWDPKTKRWRKPTDREAIKMCEEDHKLFTKGGGKGLKGDEAIDSVQRNWSKSHIARLSYKSKGKMAVNQAAGIYLGIEPVSMAGKTPKRTSEGVSVPVSTPTAVAAEVSMLLSIPPEPPKRDWCKGCRGCRGNVQR